MSENIERITVLVTRQMSEDREPIEHNFGKLMDGLAGIQSQFALEWADTLIENEGGTVGDMKIMSAPVSMPEDAYYLVIEIEFLPPKESEKNIGYAEVLDRFWNEGGIAGRFEIIAE